MKVTTKEWEKILKENNLPPAPEKVTEVQYHARNSDWWVKTKKGWYWWHYAGGRVATWQAAPLGPP
jgi:hypothetical protein